ncbi:type II toxin-antitoxin system mRNA interferase toxin, RelE/StbE family [Candidatus Peregrinibacteria bacterium]|nr:MAG: type II toxin-antitoxin system mRNA interferase toxin, RelE/StbE family [Candidatus Peregrinibacteria bacterium]
MEIKEIEYTRHFIKQFKKIDPSTKALVKKRIQLFQKNCFDPRLRTHKLKGRFKDCYSFSVNYSDRIVFKFTDEDRVAFIDVGNHSIYQ